MFFRGGDAIVLTSDDVCLLFPSPRVNQLMAGACEVLAESGCDLVGGHTAEGADMSLGFAVNGVVDPDDVRLFRLFNTFVPLLNVCTVCETCRMREDIIAPAPPHASLHHFSPSASHLCLPPLPPTPHLPFPGAA